jgi:hypothetical protein
MSNPFRKTSVNFYPVPQELNDSGALGRLSHVALRLYLHILRQAQKWDCPRVESPQWEIKQYAGVHHSGLPEAIEELQREKLLDVQRGMHNVVIFCICDPATGKAIPGGFRRVKEKERQQETAARKARKKRKAFSDLPTTDHSAVLGKTENSSRNFREQFADSPRTERPQAAETKQVASRLSEKISDRKGFFSESDLLNPGMLPADWLQTQLFGKPAKAPRRR